MSDYLARHQLLLTINLEVDNKITKTFISQTLRVSSLFFFVASQNVLSETFSFVARFHRLTFFWPRYHTLWPFKFCCKGREEGHRSRRSLASSSTLEVPQIFAVSS